MSEKRKNFHSWKQFGRAIPDRQYIIINKVCRACGMIKTEEIDSFSEKGYTKYYRQDSEYEKAPECDRKWPAGWGDEF